MLDLPVSELNACYKPKQNKVQTLWEYSRDVWYHGLMSNQCMNAGFEMIWCLTCTFKWLLLRAVGGCRCIYAGSEISSTKEKKNVNGTSP